MKILVTGGTGFIGSHLSEYLIEKGCSVKVIDDLSTGCSENTKHLRSNERFQIFIDTILNESLVEYLVKQVDVIFHLASAVGVKLIIGQPIKTIKTIIEGTNIVLSQARRYQKKVLITSSSEVYGKGSKVPFSENDDMVLGPTSIRRWAYGAAKGIDEFLAFAYRYESNLPVICVRLFNTVGLRQVGQYGMVIPTFINQALKGDDITVYGNGNQTRTFCYVGDVVPALVNLMENGDAVGKVINIGSNEEISINGLAKKVKEVTQSSSRIVHVPYEEAYSEGFEDMVRRVPDTSLAKSLINFVPKYNLSETLGIIVSETKKRGI